MAETFARAGAYRALAAASVRSLAGSPRLFVLRTVGESFQVLVEVAVPLMLVARFGSVGGWTGPELALLAAFGRSGEGLANLLGRGFEPGAFSETVRTGRFDQVLTRPVSPIGWMLTTDVQFRMVGRTIAGLAVAVWAGNRLEIGFTPAHLGLAALCIACCAVLVLSILVMGASLTFVTIEGAEVANLMSYGGLSLASFPLGIYASPLRFMFTWVVPIGLAVYLPVLVLVDRRGPGGLGPEDLWLVPTLTLAFAGLAALCWRSGLRLYRSTGS